MKSFVLSLFLVLFGSAVSVEATEEAIFSQRLAAIKEVKDVDGYKVRIDLRLFDNKPENITVHANDLSVNVIANYDTGEDDSFGSVTKSFNIPQKVDLSQAKREMN
ncbi:MAG: hypothetical protein ACK5N8_01690 [Alphaproteobacteria bacterium]